MCRIMSRPRAATPPRLLSFVSLVGGVRKFESEASLLLGLLFQWLRPDESPQEQGPTKCVSWADASKRGTSSSCRSICGDSAGRAGLIRGGRSRPCRGRQLGRRRG